ncbi:MAG: hypothetical protein ACRD35_07585 [Candidatus Acidiferrales bacterium]
MKKKILSAGIPFLVVLALCCAQFAPSAQAGTFRVTLSKGTPQVDTTGIVSGAGQWIFTVAVTGKVSYLVLNIKNNAGAGDVCWHSSTRQPKGTFTVVSSPVPAADFQTCGNRFADPDLGLNLQSYIQTGDRNAVVTIDVTYPDPTP